KESLTAGLKKSTRLSGSTVSGASSSPRFSRHPCRWRLSCLPPGLCAIREKGSSPSSSRRGASAISPWPTWDLRTARRYSGSWVATTSAFSGRSSPWGLWEPLPLQSTYGDGGGQEWSQLFKSEEEQSQVILNLKFEIAFAETHGDQSTPFPS